ncbi:MAG: phytanoyl-CoA dioxygenase family protein [Oligoflexia bacterium]|nr:phytanoyl-CoA dioxygenase family protein [Oligoflexia bacterium]
MGLSGPDQFERFGFAVLDLYSPAETTRIETFAREWLYTLLAPWVGTNHAAFPLEKYHEWWQAAGVQHADIFKAASRHRSPSPELARTIVNDKLGAFLSDIGVSEHRLWDEGLGWLAFRFIRPGHGDGYPMSCKAWGPAKSVLSCWIPVIGRSSRETLLLVPGSHKQEYERYLPEHSKFTKDEYRLATPIEPSQMLRPDLEKGQIIIYHPRTLHSEDVDSSPITRLNLELRILPEKWSSSKCNTDLSANLN